MIFLFLFLVLVSNQDNCFVNSYQVTLCQGSSYKITCPVNSLINIQSATYGSLNYLPTCSLTLINDSMSKLCNRNNSCFIEFNNKVFDMSSCPNINMYAVIKYICYPLNCIKNTTRGLCCTFPFVYQSVTYNDCTTANYDGKLWCSMNYTYDKIWGDCLGWCNGFSSEIENDCFGNQSHAVTIYENTSYAVTCVGKSLLKIQSAMYGSQEKTIKCILKNVTDVVQILCSRNSSCLIESSNAFYGGDPCPGINKYTIVNYLCFPEDIAPVTKTSSQFASIMSLAMVSEKTISLKISSSSLYSELASEALTFSTNGVYSVGIEVANPATIALSYMASITSLSTLTDSLKPTPSLPNSDLASTTQALLAITSNNLSLKTSAKMTSSQFATIISSAMFFNKTKSIKIYPSLPYSDCDSRVQALSTIEMFRVDLEEWAMWGECSATCGEGSKTRYSLKSAKIPSKRIENCIEMDCPVDGMWGSWTRSPNCSNPCPSGVVTYNRMCNSPSPAYNSLDCMGIKSYTEDCQNNIICPVIGNWLEWSDWSLCNQPCGGNSVVSRFRNCFNPKKSGLVFCKGINTETRACVFKKCETVDLNLFVNLSDVEYLDQYSNLTSKQSLELKETIKNAISRLYKYSKRSVTLSIVIHSIKY
ncbi:uncharacterized protein LOC105847054 isoform X4 [Hydra vulgaris]|uniref:uncharacterized protein LOC105847054 isoform X4 n=1 Tax=Hydra vulgaris TaxID=6087 RepID=UPI0032EA4F16